MNKTKQTITISPSTFVRKNENKIQKDYKIGRKLG